MSDISDLTRPTPISSAPLPTACVPPLCTLLPDSILLTLDEAIYVLFEKKTLHLWNRSSTLLRHPQIQVLSIPFTMRWLDINFFRDNFRITTWLLFGACFQSCLVLFLPRNIALLPAFTVLIIHIITSGLKSRGLISDSHADRVVFGRATARIPNDDGTFSKGIADKQICVFILAGRSNQ